MSSLPDIRKSYEKGALDESGVPPEPLAMFQAWLQQAVAAGLPDPTAMTLATVGPEEIGRAHV